MGFGDNPIIFLTKRMWEFSKGNRKNVILFSLMFIVVGVIYALDPLILATLLNIIQEQGVTQDNIFLLLGLIALFPILSVVFWSLHGPARVLERNNAFIVRANYKKFLLNGIMDLPSQWHADHHSGDIIDKVSKATTHLHKFSSRLFMIIEAAVKLITAYIALIYFNLHASYIVLLVFIVTMGIAIRFDEKLKKEYKILFKMENKISARIYDAISNINTVIILRIAKLLEKDLIKKIMHPYKLYAKNAKGIEIKWFTISIFTRSLSFIILGSYILAGLWGGATVLVGTIAALAAYTDRINNVSFRFADYYGEIVKQKAAYENMEEISNQFSKKKKVKQIDLNSKWKTLDIKNLRFSYHNKEGGDLHLRNISLSFKRTSNSKASTDKV